MDSIPSLPMIFPISEVSGAAAVGVAVEPLRVVLRTNEELGTGARQRDGEIPCMDGKMNGLEGNIHKNLDWLVAWNIVLSFHDVHFFRAVEATNQMEMLMQKFLAPLPDELTP